MVRRDLADAAHPALSEDRRFATAYSAALQVARTATACSGYRVAAVQAIMLSVLNVPPWRSGNKLVDWCCSSMPAGASVIDYTGVQPATSTEAAELHQHTQKFNELVESLIRKTHSHLS